MKTLIRLGCLLGALAPVLLAAPKFDGDVMKALAERPRLFEQNVGQFDPRVGYFLRGVNYHAYVQSDSVVYTWFKRTDADPNDPFSSPSWDRTAAIRMTLEGAYPMATVEGVGEASHSHSYLGPQYADRAGIRPPRFERVAARSVYAGVDVEHYMRGQQLEHDFIVAAGADPGVIRLRFDGIDSVEIAPSGDLVLVSGEHKLVQQAPYVYQGSFSEPTVVEASYRQLEDGSIFYELGDYDRSKPLVIDPIAWTTYAGGGGVDIPIAIEAGPLGRAVILVASNSEVYPVTAESKLNRRAQGFEPTVKLTWVDGDSDRFVTDSDDPSISFSVSFFPTSLDVTRRYSDEELPADSKQQTSGSTIAERIAAGAQLAMVGGSGENPVSVNGQVPQGRVDGIVMAILIPGAQEILSPSAPLGPPGGVHQGSGPRPELLDYRIIGGEFNDGIFSVHVVDEFKNGELPFFVVGSSSDLASLNDTPANPHNDKLDGFAVAYGISFPNGGFQMDFRDHTYWGTLENDSFLAADAFENSSGQCVISSVIVEGGTSQSFAEVAYDPELRQFISAAPLVPLSFPDGGRPAQLQANEERVLFGGQNPSGLLFEHFRRGGPGSLTQLESVSVPGTGARLTALEPTTDPNQFNWVANWPANVPAPAPGSGSIPPYGEADDTQARAVAGSLTLEANNTALLPRSLGSSDDPKRLQVGGAMVLGAGGSIVFDSNPDGAFALAGLTTTPVFGPGLPEPLLPLSNNPGPGDLFAYGGGQSSADPQITITGPASFVVEPLAQGGIGTGFAPDLAPAGQTAFAPSVPLPNNLLGSVAMLIDSAGTQWPLGQFFLNSNQMNFYVPPAAALGSARVEVNTAAGDLLVGHTQIALVQPNIFKFSDGTGAALTVVLKADGSRIDTDNTQNPEIAVSLADTLIFSEFGTGAVAGQTFEASCGGFPANVLSAAQTPGFLGLEQVAIVIDIAAIGGTGPQRVVCTITVDGIASNQFDVRYAVVP